MSLIDTVENEDVKVNGAFSEEEFENFKLDIEGTEAGKNAGTDEKGSKTKREFANVNVRIPLAVMPKVKAVAILSGYEDVEKFIADAAQDKAGILQMKISSAINRASSGRKKKGAQ